MMGFRSPLLKPFKVGLNALVYSFRLTTGLTKHLTNLNQVQHQSKSLVITSVITAPSSLKKIEKHIVYSRHADCYLHNQTVVQRFFERASLWPNLTALVRPSMYPNPSKRSWVFLILNAPHRLVRLSLLTVLIFKLINCCRNVGSQDGSTLMTRYVNWSAVSAVL
jgi:hypothetical protein